MTNKKKKSNIQICTLDTETRGLFGAIFRIGFYDGINYVAFNSMAECYDYIKLLAKEKELHIFIHNLDFDLSKMAKELLKDIDFNNSVFIEQNVAIFSTNINIILHDSLKLIPSSLDKICKDFNLGAASKIDLSEHIKANGYKDKEDYFNRVDPKEEMLNEYLKFDCTSLHTVIMQLIDISGLTVEEFIQCPTTASLSMRVFKELFPDDYDDSVSSNYRHEYGQKIEQFLRKGYYGGRTEVFIPYLENGFHYDVNSLYPYVMKSYEFPIGWYDVFENEKARSIYRMWKRNKKGGGFIAAKVYVPEHLNIPPLPYRAKNDKSLMGKLIFPVGKLDGVWSFPELELAEKVGCVIEEYKTVVYYKKTYPIFREFINQFEYLKTHSKGAKRTFAKLMQNSLYGKYGMIRERRTLLPVSEFEHEMKIAKEENLPYPVKLRHPYLKSEFIQAYKKVNAAYIQVQIAAYVTSYARILLYEGLTNELNGDIAYCDTDSIACSNEFDSELVHESEYGKWKLENELEYGIFLQPKLYMEKSKDGTITTKAKGVPKNILNQFNEETYLRILNDIKSGQERIEFFGTEHAIFDKEVIGRNKFVSSLKDGKDFDVQIKLRKGMNLRAKQKRIMNYKKNFSKPHKVIDY